MRDSPEAKKSPMAVAQFYILALRQHSKGKLPEAENLCRKVLAIDPNHIKSLDLLSTIAQQCGRRDVAANLQGNIGSAFLASGHFTDAEDHFARAVAFDPDSAHPHNNIGIAIAQQGRLKEAIQRFQQALAINPNYAEAHSNLGLSLEQLGKVDEAISHYLRALAVKPNYPEAHNNLGVCA